jgi:hypothetical protein
MKDSEQQILNAFLFALAQQGEPLANAIQSQIHEISQFLDQRVTDLDDLAIATPSLAKPYQQAYRLLNEGASQRSKGVPPAEEDEGENSGERDNVMLGDIQPKLLEAQKLLNAIQQKPDQAQRILSAEDSVQQARQAFQ